MDAENKIYDMVVMMFRKKPVTKCMNDYSAVACIEKQIKLEFEDRLWTNLLEINIVKFGQCPDQDIILHL